MVESQKDSAEMGQNLQDRLINNILIEDLVKSLSVSSVLNKNTKQYGKKHLMDGKDETCWHSDPGLPQWITVKYESPQKVSSIQMTSQGGFSPREMVLIVDGQEVTRFEVADQNLEQEFRLSQQMEFKVLKMEFVTSSDFFGRIVIYSLKLIQ